MLSDISRVPFTAVAVAANPPGDGFGILCPSNRGICRRQSRYQNIIKEAAKNTL